MSALLRVHVENFRSLRDVTVPLGPLNVLVGPNAAGKTNFLDVIDFLGDSVRSDLRPAFDVRGGFDRVRFRGKTSGQIKIEIQANVTKNSSRNAPDVYELQISLGRLVQRRNNQPERRVLIRNESFKFKRTAGAGRRITIAGGKVQVIDERAGAVQQKIQFGLDSESLGLATLPRLSDNEGGAAIRAIAQLFATFRVFDVDVHAARLPSGESPPGILQSDAGNLASFLYWLQEMDGERFDELQEDAREFVPGLEAIEFAEIGGPSKAISLQLVEKGLRDKTDLADASFGTIRALAILALLYDPYPPPLTCVEEVDHGLHPYVFDRLVERLREASQRSQLLIATHSPALVNRLHPSELIVVERDDDGSTRMPAIPSQDVAAIEKAAGNELGLGEIWFAGTLGGVPD